MQSKQIWFALGLSALLSVPALAQAPFATFERASEPVLNDPHDLTLGPDGKLYVADKFGHRIVAMDAETLEILDVIDEGKLPGIHDISFGPDGKAYVAVTGGSVVAIYSFVDGRLSLDNYLGSFPNTEGVLAHSNGRLYVMASGSGDLVAVSGTTMHAISHGHFGAHDVAEALDGTIWLADNARSRLIRFSEDLEQLQVLDDPKFGFIGPRYVDVDDFGRLVVADQDAHRIVLINPETERLIGILGDGMPGIGPYSFDDPEGALVVGNTYYFADSDNNRIVKYVVILN